MSASAVTASDDANESLATTFYRAQRLCQAPSRTPAEAESLLRLLESLNERIRQASLFSSNEEAEDLSTSSMKYLLVAYYAGQVESSFPCGISERLAHLTRGMEYYVGFVKRLDEYKLADKAEVEQFKAASREFDRKLKSPPSSAASAGPPRPSRPADPAAARNAKIARFKQERELTQQLEAMQLQRRNRIKAQKGDAESASRVIGSNTNEADEELIDSSSDDQSVRAFYTLLFKSLLLTTVDAAKSAVDEVDILLHHRNVELAKPKDQQLHRMTAEERVAHFAATDPRPNAKPVMMKMTPESLFQPIPEHMKSFLQNPAVSDSSAASAAAAAPASAAASSSAASAMPSFVPSTVARSVDSMINARVNARAETFKLTNQPTYTIEQWAEMEIAAGRLPGPNNDPQPRAPDPRRIRSGHDRDVAEEMVDEFKRTQLGGDASDDEDGLGHEDGAAGREQDEMRTMKAREWDNWKDDHQKGVGNSIK